MPRLRPPSTVTTAPAAPAALPFLGVLARLVLGGVWLAAGLLKLGDPTESVRAVRAYDLLPEALVPAVGHGLPVLEVALGVLLVTGALTRLAAGVSVGLLVAFVVGIASAWARGLSIECGCFGGGGGPAQDAAAAYPWEIARDIGLLALALLLVWRPRTPWSVDQRLMPAPTPAPAEHVVRRASARRAAALQHAEREAGARKHDRGVLVVGAVALAVVVGLGGLVQSSRDLTGATASASGAAVPDGTTGRYALGVGSVDAPVVVDVYEDFLCPYCGQLEQLTRGVVDRYAGTEVQVRYHVLSFLDRASTDRYSTRAANALGAVLDTAGPAAAKRFHDELYADQPEEGGAGLSDDELVDLAVQAGARRAEVAGPIDDLAYEGWVADATDAASRAGVTGTPTVLVDGERIGGADIPSMAAQLEQTLREKTA